MKPLIAVALLVLATTAGCRSGARAAVVNTPSSPSSSSAPVLPDSIRWVRASAEYVAAFEQTYRLATARIESVSQQYTAGSWAVVLDADETILNSSEYEELRARAGLPYTEDSWDVWVKRRSATPLPGAAAFLNRLHVLGGRSAIVTNRLQSQCADTQAVFASHSLPFDVMLCRPDGQPSDKNPRFRAVESGAAFGLARPVTVVAYLGDNIQDFPKLSQQIRPDAAAFADFGVRYFVFPNPMYGSWQER